MQSPYSSVYKKAKNGVRSSIVAQPATKLDLTPHDFFLPCPRGLETALADEVAALAKHSSTLRAGKPAPGGLPVQGSLTDAMRLNLHCRLTSRVLLLGGSCGYVDAEDIYHLARDLAWEKWFGVAQALRVDVTAERSPLESIKFAALRVKDGICDRFRALTGERPDVDTAHPDVRIHLHLREADALLYLDTSGEPLFKRGWRSEQGAAPLKEHLAAGLLRLSGWTPGDVLFDPMCGAGTLVIEAAQMAAQRAPGLDRTFGFEVLKGFDLDAWAAMREQARQSVRLLAPGQFFAADIDPANVRMTLDNARRAGVVGAIAAQAGDVIAAMPPVDAAALPAGQRAWLISNPPYSERIAPEGEAADDFAPLLARTLKQRFAGWHVALLAADLHFDRALRLKPRRRIVVFNGTIECRLMLIDMVAGSARGQV
ncbi:MAG: THUMP domain-containing protein [Thiomonas sp.]|uniref:THUMP domain-containing class I SAM-dependent RNA methyltransferase n=1 Tax=Thiomonas sp. TaxID=2047785 RepID=UPI002A35F1ED|nr:THUMP domain-containing protein [Thiomonas sp.]MDY0330903.1 THUMP domain-containing protein [Thiomonas sp.]